MFCLFQRKVPVKIQRQHRRLFAVHLFCFHILRPSGEFQCLLRRKRHLDPVTGFAEECLLYGDSLQRSAPRQPLPSRVPHGQRRFCPVRQVTSRNFYLQPPFRIGNAKIFHIHMVYDENAAELFPVCGNIADKFPEQPLLLHRQRADLPAVLRD